MQVNENWFEPGSLIRVALFQIIPKQGSYRACTNNLENCLFLFVANSYTTHTKNSENYSFWFVAGNVKLCI